MGVDVNLYAEVDPGPEQLAAAEAYFVARSRLGSPDEKYPNVLVVDADTFDRPRVEVLTMNRYYGEGYERGDWPCIYGGIRVLQAAFPGARVFYGGDTDDDGQECTPEFLSGVWDHFLSPKGDNYYQSWR